MTGAAVRRALYQISATVPLWAPVRFVLISAFFQEQGIPCDQRPAHSEWPREVGLLIFLINRFNAMHKIGIKAGNIIISQLGIRREWHCRIKIRAVAPDTFTQHFLEVVQ
ncbi:hypothetical protein D3C80_1570070 [compost metagenome]